MKKLFLVVFQDDYQRVVMYDHMANPVTQPIVLLENH